MYFRLIVVCVTDLKQDYGGAVFRKAVSRCVHGCGRFFCINCGIAIYATNIVDCKMPCILEIKLYSPVKYTVLNFGTSLGGPSLCPFLTGAQADQIIPNPFLSSKVAVELSQTAMK